MMSIKTLFRYINTGILPKSMSIVNRGSSQLKRNGQQLCRVQELNERASKEAMEGAFAKGWAGSNVPPSYLGCKS
jgi:hypothetical protein